MTYSTPLFAMPLKITNSAKPAQNRAQGLKTAPKPANSSERRLSRRRHFPRLTYALPLFPPNCALINKECRTRKWANRPLFYFSDTLMAAVENKELLERITEIGERSAMGTDIELVEIQLKGAGNARLLRVYIDKPGGVTHGDCELISERFGKLLDAEDPIPENSYTLEVSSPGIERRLSKPRDFERVVGQKIRLAVQPPGESRRQLEGRLAQFANGALELEVAPGNLVRIPLETVQKANLKFEW